MTFWRMFRDSRFKKGDQGDRNCMENSGDQDPFCEPCGLFTVKFPGCLPCVSDCRGYSWGTEFNKFSITLLYLFNISATLLQPGYSLTSSKDISSTCKRQNVTNYFTIEMKCTGNVPEICPTFNEKRENRVSVFPSLYPRRTVVGIDARNLYENGGMIHCVTQQQPDVIS